MRPNDNNESAHGEQPRLLGFEATCPDCAVAVGEPHVYDECDGGCDVARCLDTGLQRLLCDLDHDRDCGRDIWTGWWPGLVDCEQFGWMHGPGFPDLNRLYTEATWDRARCAWVKPD